MIYSGYEMIWLFFVYSFLGWVMETVMAALKQKRFTNRGLVNAPLCVTYGNTALIVTPLCSELHGVWLFVGCMLLATLIEWISGHWIEFLYHERWWDYSGIKWNLDGYICLPVSILWGVLNTVMMEWGNPLAVGIYDKIPRVPGEILIWILSGILAVDVIATLCILSGRSRRISQWQEVDSWLSGISSKLGRRIYGWTDRRIRKAYPDARLEEEEVSEEELRAREQVFAYGCCIYKLIWLLVIGAFLGDVVETIFCRITAGVWMSRSSVVWGPFSLVWGVAIAAATKLLYKYRHYSDRFIFLTGTFLGGAYEYACSVLSELVFGKVFWDYSNIPFNLGGRINLLYCFFWGIAAVVWIKGLYPIMSGWIERIPKKAGKILTWVLVAFFCCNIIVSGLALIRSDQRRQEIPAEQTWQQMMDEHYPDEKLDEIYPNAIETD